VKTKRVVAFIKGTRTAPECGFSHQVLHLLNQSKVEYETVNVLDVIHNPGLREAIKVYSEWPTIPQVYVDGEFIGGADIVIEMGEKGELVDALQPKA
jgi:Grx4 family monothiol glutaredoxin